MTRRRNRTLGAFFVAGMLVAGSPSCSSDKARDQNYGKEAGADFEAPPEDSGADAPGAGGADGGVADGGGEAGGAEDGGRDAADDTGDSDAGATGG